jgi:dihydropteroate synthase
MQDDPRYDDVVLDIFDWLERRVETCVAAGIARENIVADPGIGFGKTHVHNLELMAALTVFHGLGVPVLVGASRKGFIGKLTGEARAGERVMGSVAAAMVAFSQGIQIVRAHDVAETAKALAVWRACLHTQALPA